MRRQVLTDLCRDMSDTVMKRRRKTVCYALLPEDVVEGDCKRSSHQVMSREKKPSHH